MKCLCGGHAPVVRAYLKGPGIWKRSKHNIPRHFRTRVCQQCGDTFRTTEIREDDLGLVLDLLEDATSGLRLSVRQKYGSSND